jgi:raffinose/stachyose/melibiose transport system substrate-binding protein
MKNLKWKLICVFNFYNIQLLIYRRKSMKKKLIGIFAVVVATSFIFAACSTSNNTSSKVSSATSYVAPVATTGTIQVETGYDNANTLAIWNAACDDFSAQYPGITIQDTNVGTKNYDTLMQVKVAADNLPDVFGIAGWPNLYAPDCVNLQYEPWVSRIYKGEIPSVSSASGELIAEPLNQANEGLEYNVGLLKQYGIDPNTQLTTFSGLMSACKTINTKSNGSVYAMYIGGGDGWPLGLYYNFMSVAYCVNGNNPDATALLNGTYTWSDWPTFAEQMKAFAGYFNPDYLTAKNSSQIEMEAQNKVVFDWGSGDVPSVQKLNPNIQWSFVPLPAWKSGQSNFFVGNVHDTLAIWNQSKVVDDCRLFLNYWAQPQNVKPLCDIQTYQGGLTGVDVANIDNARYAQFASVPIYSIFDQGYLPNGMWNVLVTEASAYNAGSETAQQFASDMQSNYTRLYAQANASSST